MNKDLEKHIGSIVLTTELAMPECMFSINFKCARCSVEAELVLNEVDITEENDASLLKRIESMLEDSGCSLLCDDSNGIELLSLWQ